MSADPKYVRLPCLRNDHGLWVLLKPLGSRLRVRASFIGNPYNTHEPNNHAIMETKIQSSAKVTSTRVWEIENFVLEQPTEKEEEKKKREQRKKGKKKGKKKRSK